ncbi:MAG: hypothetical protein N2Z76_05395 [Treponemataceae bacterium]|nr:hypothetical protein [Treponemataceae bacterium]
MEPKCYIQYGAGIFLVFLFGTACTAPRQSPLDFISSEVRPPVFLGAKSLDTQTFELQFSTDVELENLSFDLPTSGIEVQHGTTCRIVSETAFPRGARITISGRARDTQNNTLDFIVPLRVRNDRIPQLVITEVRTEYSKPKVEFIELYIRSSGNLGGLRIISSSCFLDSPLYEFEPTEVRQGEYVVLHLRSIEDTLQDERGDNLALSGGTEAHPQSRDFWLPGNTKKIRKTDGIALIDQDNHIIDALLISETSEGPWQKNEMIHLCSFLAAQQAWVGNSATLFPADAVLSSYTTATRTICRDETREDSHSAADWYITATSGASPGEPNKTTRYEPTSKKLTK